jgi:S-adenosylmethionine hydrolase
MMNDLITLTTDFGLGAYAAAMKGVIMNINPHSKIVDITHLVRRQNLIEGAYVLYATAPYFPHCVHVGVVDPGVGTSREGLLIECERGVLVGPDNGLLLPCARKLGLRRIFRLSNPKYFLEPLSNTFHGRDVFAPVAAHLTRGVKPSEMGEEFKDYMDLKLEYHEEINGNLKGRLLFIDRFGNLITSISREIMEKYLKYNDEIKIEFVGRGNSEIKKVRFVRTYGDEEPGELLATISSSGFLEISCNMGSALEIIKVAPILEILVNI